MKINHLLGLLCALFGAALCTNFSLAQTSFRADFAHSGVFNSRSVANKPALRWKFDTQGPVHSSPTLAGNAVFFGSGDGNVYALHAASGKMLWKFQTGGGVDSSPAVAGGTVFFASRDGNFYAVDARNGKIRWQTSIGADLPFIYGYDYLLSSPVIADDQVIVGSGDGALYSFSTKDGKIKWRFGTGGRIRSSPAMSNGVVFVGNMDGMLYAVNAYDGKLVWKFETDGVSFDSGKAGFDRRSIISSPAVARGIVTFGSRDARHYALDEKTGRLLWKFGHAIGKKPNSPEVSWVVGSPAISGEVTFVGSSDARFVNARDLRTGRELWRFDTPQSANSSPAVAGDLLIIGCGDGNVYGLDAKTGEEKWRFQTGDGVKSSPAVAAGVVYFGSDDGSLYAISDLKADGKPAPQYAVYYDETVPGWFSGGKEVRDSLKQANYTVLDLKSLSKFLEEQINSQIPSVVVFATDRPPSDVLDATGSSAPLIRRYLDSGGRIVWFGVSPFIQKLDLATGKIAGAEPDAMRRVLGFAEPLDASAGEELYSKSTIEGLRWGLPEWSVSSFSVDEKDVTVVLSRDGAGRSTAWVKKYGSNDAGAFVRFWGREKPLADIRTVRRLAEYGLQK